MSRESCFLAICLFLLTAIAADAAEHDGLVGRWPLAGNARDASGEGHDGRAESVDFSARGPDGLTGTAARFDGRTASIEIPAAETLALGASDFSIALWVHAGRQQDQVGGDLISKFDPVTRRGFNLAIKNNSVTMSQANSGNIVFGIDGGTDELRWIDRGRPGNAVFVCSLCVHAGNLYAGTCEPELDQAGHVYRFAPGEAGESQWIDCGSPDPCNSVMALAVHDGQLYAGVAKYRLRGSALPESPNPNQGGRVYRYDGERRWVDCGALGESEGVGGMAVYRGRLYATSLYAPAGFFRYEGGTRWTSLDTPNGKRAGALAVFQDQLYASSYDGGRVYRYDGESWTDLGQLGENTQTYSLAVYEGQLHVSTWPSGRVYRHAGGQQWEDRGQLGEEREVMGMVVHNGKLYGGTLPLAHVFRYDGDNTWTDTGRLDLTPNVTYRRAWSMAEYRGELFCGTLPSGRILSLAPGRSVSFDDALLPGWHHLAAVRQGERLLLYIDGKQVSSSAPLEPAKFDLTNRQPLRIGFGPNDRFHGELSDVRLYGRALDAKEIAALAGP